ncbi:MAG TPA: hypothetical protein VG106_07645 [Vicinamibacterales bacterium]|nr:hypothetical protein [Vicinamibacterales bacterium]
MRRSLALLALLLAACGTGGSGTGSRPSSIAQPDVSAYLTHDVFFGSGDTAPATIEVTVTNRANEAIVLRRVEVESPGMVTHGILRTQRDFRETISAGETKSVTIFATAQTFVRRPTEPLTIRATVDFEAQGTRWRHIVNMQP